MDEEHRAAFTETVERQHSEAAGDDVDHLDLDGAPDPFGGDPEGRRKTPAGGSQVRGRGGIRRRAVGELSP